MVVVATCENDYSALENQFSAEQPEKSSFDHGHKTTGENFLSIFFNSNYYVICSLGSTAHILVVSLNSNIVSGIYQRLIVKKIEL